MEVGLLYEGFSEAEVKTVPIEISKKLLHRWQTRCEEVESLKSEYETFKTENEQGVFDLQQKLAVLNTKFKDESRKRSEFESQNKLNEDKLSDQGKELQQLSTKNSTLSCQLQISKSEGDNMVSNSTALSATLEAKDMLVADLKARIAALEEQVSSAMRAKAEALIQSEEALSMQSRLEHQEKRLSEERGLLRGQIQMLHTQIDERIQENTNLRHDHASSLVQLKQDLHTATTETRVMKQYQEDLEKKAEDKTKKVEELLKALKEARENELKLEESFNMELTAQKKLSSIHQASSEDLNLQKGELERGVSELRSLLENASQQYGALERAKELQALCIEETVLKNEELIKELRDELDKVNILLEVNAKKDHQSAMYELTPGGNAAAQLLGKGLTLSQLYAEHLTATDKLLKSEEENTRLTRYIDQILQEIEERAPVLQQQREHYTNAIETIASLQQQLQSNTLNSHGMREENCELERRCKFLLREQDSLTAQNTDLGKQVTVLLTQVEAARAGLPPPNIDVDELMAGGEGDVVSSHLLGFRDVSELQQQNQKLVHTIRELKEQADQAEKLVFEKYLQDIQEELSSAKAEMEELRDGRDRIQALVENISRQRDTYRSLLAQANASKGVKDFSVDASSPSDGASETDGSEQIVRQEINKLNINLAAVKKTEQELREQLKSEHKKFTDQVNVSQKQIEGMRVSMDKTREQNVKLLSHAEYNEERLKTMQGNCESYQRQVNALEEKEATLQSIVTRHEATLDQLRLEHKTLVQRFAHAEVIANNLREEKLIFKETEARLLAEKESNSRNASSQALLMASLESIKNNLEHMGTSDRMRTQNQISDLTDHNNRLKAKLDGNTELREIKTKLATLEEQLRSSEKDREQSADHLKTAREHINMMQQRYDETLNREKELTLQIRDLQSNGAAGGSEGDSSSFSQRDLEVQLAEEKAKAKSLERTLQQMKQSHASLTDTCERQEKELKDSSNASDTALNRIEEISCNKNSLEKRVLKLTESLLILENTILNLKQRLADAENNMANYNEVVDNARLELEEARNMETESRKRVEESRKEVLEVQQKYEREVMLHGTDLQALSKLKEQLSTHNQRLERASNDKISAEETLKEVQKAGTNLQDTLKRECEGLSARNKELEEQNKDLLDQFVQVSDKMTAVQNKIMSGQESQDTNISNVSFTEEDARTSDQLREVLKYLRRERELATSRSEVSGAEANRFKAQWESANKHVEQLTKELASERENKQVSMDAASRYGELLRKVHTVDALADSNRLLRQEKDVLKQKTDVAENKASTLVAEVEPLRTKVAEALAEVETLQVEKKSTEKEVELYKKRTQDLVEKLNRAKPEEFLRIQQELNAAKVGLHAKETECNRMKMQVQQLQKNLQTMVTSKEETKKQLTLFAQERRSLVDENKKLSMDKSRLVQQVGQQQEKLSSMQQEHEQELRKYLDQKNKASQQIGDARQKEETAIRMSEQHQKKSEALLLDINAKDFKIAESTKQIIQLRKIASKYKKGSESALDLEKKVLELEQTVATLKTQLEEQQTKTDSSESSSRSKVMEGELTRLRADIEAKAKELTAYKAALTDANKKVEESVAKKAVYESRILQLEKLLSGQRASDKQTLTSKPSTSGSSTSSDKSSQETSAPPTANIKPLASTTPSVTASPSPRTAPAPPPSRSIPTASIRPLAAAGPSLSSTVMGLPRDIHSEGLVSSSTVTLPQATVTPTPATPTATLPSTATTSATSQHTSSLPPTPVTLTATVSPTTPLTAHPTANQMTAPVAAAAMVVVPQQEPEPMEQQQQLPDVGEDGGSSVQQVVAVPAADDLVSQAVALIVPASGVVVESLPGPSSGGIPQKNVGQVKRKRDAEEQEESIEEEDVETTKRSRVEVHQQPATEGDASSSSSVPPPKQRGAPAPQPPPEVDNDDVILVESDEEEEQQAAPVRDMEAPSESYQSVSGVPPNNGGQQQPSSSSGALRQAALVMPLPLGANNDRVGSSGGAGEGSTEEGSSERVTRRIEANEPVSSPQRGGAPHSPAGESGVSTSDSIAAICVDNQLLLSGGGGYTEADSAAPEVVEDIEDEEEEDEGTVDEEEDDEERDVEDDEERDVEDDDESHNNDNDDEDDVVEVPEDDDEEMSEDHQQPGEAQQQKFISSGGDSSGAEEVSGSFNYAAPSSSSSLAPSSPSSSRRRDITPITWDGPANRGGRGIRSGPYRSSDRLIGRRAQDGQQLSPEQQQQQQPQSPQQVARGGAVQQQRAVRGGQKARRSRQPHM